jgi:putative addiction module killer protein
MIVEEKEVYLFYDRNKKAEPLKKWILSFDKIITATIFKRIKRVRNGNYGDCKPIGSGVSELRFKNGLRIYFSEVNSKVVLLFCGGDKSTQQKDIEISKEYKKILDNKGLEYCINF